MLRRSRHGSMLHRKMRKARMWKRRTKHGWKALLRGKARWEMRTSVLVLSEEMILFAKVTRHGSLLGRRTLLLPS